jgi:hypothetical protein
MSVYDKNEFALAWYEADYEVKGLCRVVWVCTYGVHAVHGTACRSGVCTNRLHSNMVLTRVACVGRSASASRTLTSCISTDVYDMYTQYKKSRYHNPFPLASI